MGSQYLDNDVVNGRNGRSTSCFLLDAGPAYFRTPTSVLVKSPFTNLDD